MMQIAIHDVLGVAREASGGLGEAVHVGRRPEVIYGDEDPHRLTVEYDAGLMNSVDLVDFLHLWGLVAEAVPAFMPNNVTDR